MKGICAVEIRFTRLLFFPISVKRPAPFVVNSHTASGFIFSPWPQSTTQSRLADKLILLAHAPRNTRAPAARKSPVLFRDYVAFVGIHANPFEEGLTLHVKQFLHAGTLMYAEDLCSLGGSGLVIPSHPEIADSQPHRVPWPPPRRSGTPRLGVDHATIRMFHQNLILPSGTGSGINNPRSPEVDPNKTTDFSRKGALGQSVPEPPQLASPRRQPKTNDA